jgi:hypothetical protein
MARIPAFLLVVLLLAGCPRYDVDVAMEVDASGAVGRRMVLKAIEKDDIWACFQKPGEPWVLSGDAPSGFVAEARVAAPKDGGNGLRQRGAADDAYEGTLTVEALDCVLGTLYRYRETPGSGLDAERVSREADRWALLSVRIFLRAMETRFREVDRTALEKHFLENVAPRAAQSVREALPHAALLCERYRRRDGRSPMEDGSFPALLALLARFGPELPVDLFLKGLDADAVSVQVQGEFARREVAPHLPEPDRARVLESFEKPGQKWDEALTEAYGALLPDPVLRAQTGADAARFLDAALGAGITRLFLESLEMRYSLALPGTLLRTNGDLTAYPKVTWRLGKDDLSIAPTTLFAVSFAPKEWAGTGRWIVEELLDAREAFQALPEEGRADAAARIRKGCEKDFDAAKEGAPEEVGRVVERFKSLVTDARSS